ncbi:folylpolyglutamate synthase, mitochondrial-like isoform X2 [Osmia bicornis bicornis]|uniref:folylpolyglutamate synthase, mitochondrial-like isoform X2 n=1 Tax=Osmia bicornis bicornis TaxID=1437191 RepID=UPI0010F97BD1|nr:folylpolyglutamate synthase, mitochondrial-like isoform X2 [Osmia bicornis bicornis]
MILVNYLKQKNIYSAGTKGKGSTCAYTEAILREHNFSTGFFSSPHLVNVRERIRINGQPLSEICFSQHFWKVYKKLEDRKEHEFDMPTYFKFITILMFNVFLDANVDVAIIEVGIGGENDCTNIVRNTVCVGITSLALDHTSTLGNTIEDIAYQKSGIFKPKTTAFTVPQLPRAMCVLEKRAVEKNCMLDLVCPFEEYRWGNLSPILKITSNIQQQNASLAIQMATTWMTKTDKYSDILHNAENDNQFYNKYKENTQLNRVIKSNIIFMDKIAVGISSCKWPGRMQILETSIANFFLDGAHTIESSECCISWFNDVISKRRGKRFLIFNTSGTRDSEKLLVPLKSLHFYKAYFVPNFAGIKSIDDETNCSSMDEQRHKCEINANIWGTDSLVKNSVNEVFQDIKKNFEKEVNHNNDEKYQILITGSLHLVGAALTILDPNLTMSSQYCFEISNCPLFFV